MRMYVANGTKFNYEFQYRLPEQNGIRRQIIPIGSQVMLSDDLRREDIDAVVEQHARYGMVPVEQAKSLKVFTGLCFSVDRPVQMAQIQMLMEHNADELVKRGREIRQEAAIASNNHLENSIQEEAPDGFRLRNLEMSVVEEHPERNDSGRPVAEGYRVTREDGPQERPSRGRRGR